tara:strand:- start:33 stop:674 length:642 start_codon:yes stop_codon:yes gene_type:complete
MAILDNFFNTLYGQDRIAGLEAKYGTGGTGQPSQARHQSAVSQLNKNINIDPYGPFSVLSAGVASLGEIPDVIKTGDVKESLRDIRDNFIGITKSNKTPEEIYEDIYGVGSLVDPNATAMMPIGTIISGAKGIFGGKSGAAVMKKMGKDVAAQKAIEKMVRQKIEQEMAERAARENARRMSMRNRFDNTGGYQAGYSDDFMSGSGTAAEMGSS